MAGAAQRAVPFPTTQAEREAAKQLHLKARAEGSDIPYFIKPDGSVHYLDNKGGGKFGFNDLGTKLANEAARKAKKRSSMPTLEMYTDVFGPETGPQLFEQEQLKLKNIYKYTDSSQFDVDHINSSADGGVHFSGNLRMQNASINRSEGARGLPDVVKQGLNLVDNPRDQIAMQGPRMTPFQRQGWIQSMGAGVRFGFAKLNRAQDAYDLFMWGARGEAQAEELANVLPGMRPDPETDLGKRVGDAIANEIEYIKSNGNGEGIYGSKPSNVGPRYSSGNGGLSNDQLARLRNPYNPSEIAQQ